MIIGIIIDMIEDIKKWQLAVYEVKNMKYKIKYSMPYDIYRYVMDAKDEDQLLTFLKMLRDEQAYGFEVVPEYTIAR